MICIIKEKMKRDLINYVIREIPHESFSQRVHLALFRSEQFLKAKTTNTFDFDAYDLSKHTIAIEVADHYNETRGTVRLIKKADHRINPHNFKPIHQQFFNSAIFDINPPELPIYQYHFREKGKSFVSYRKFLGRDAESQVSGLAISQELKNTSGGYRILHHLFSSCFYSGTEQNIQNAIICAKPVYTSIYEKVGAEILAKDIEFVHPSRNNEIFPADILFIKLSNLEKYLFPTRLNL